MVTITNKLGNKETEDSTISFFIPFKCKFVIDIVEQSIYDIIAVVPAK